jgi:predicted site-specific integrase-resolvase
MNEEYSNLVTLEVYARKKKRSLKTIYNWIKSGKVKPVVIGKSKFIKLKS